MRLKLDTHWPHRVSNPTPYEIFSVNPSTKPNKRLLRDKYLQYAKLYHPDLDQQVQCGGVVLTRRAQLERFKVISHAYECLRTGAHPSSCYAGRSHPASTAAAADYRYWRAGTWEDQQDWQTHASATASGSEGERDSDHILAYVFGFLVCLQGTYFLAKLQDKLLVRRDDGFDHGDVEVPELIVPPQLGEPQEQFSEKLVKLRRFLWIRSWLLFRDDEQKLNNEIARNEKLISRLNRSQHQHQDEKSEERDTSSSAET
ncbi:Jid1p KNAG_0H00730 [Huiozyma naganishii CBS 8797]|uniref:J domain-containing protein n=1 Tax=Huiozyma naganishii (strain ATCC MYA-139 / BCRC 22969 / CBS 8797 / KCTC 17520 / NBRC 10181 / NCYC 3082 / Yp74L-3) TaxID=1071383 RepID=J7RP97_HUIN7|nr:hypothetical protein KNAG_0H00730 [Kazachstania naganishii CBS 8797]CCK71488.1 hypothetical protein KNAG_0H00730 [Kazachstania naganishii CBS 8797]